MMQATHFQIRGGSHIYQTRAGVRPGDAIADVLYVFLQADFLHALQAAAVSDGLLGQDALDGSPLAGRLLVSTRADDCVALLSASSPQLLLRRLCAAAQLAHHQLHVRGTAPNYGKGKTTEALVQFLGAGAQTARQTLFITNMRLPAGC